MVTGFQSCMWSFLYQFEVCSIGSSKMIANSLKVLNFNCLVLKLNRFIYLPLAVGPLHSLHPIHLLKFIGDDATTTLLGEGGGQVFMLDGWEVHSYPIILFLHTSKPTLKWISTCEKLYILISALCNEVAFVYRLPSTPCKLPRWTPILVQYRIFIITIHVFVLRNSFFCSNI